MTRKNISRRDALKTIGSLSLGAALGSIPLKAAGSNTRPNIIFIMTDDHAAHALSCYGSQINTTPNLDRIANEGLRLTNCFITNSLCAPSRASLLTGKYSHQNGITENIYGGNKPFDGSQQTFPKLLQQAGYQTAMIGKWHLESHPTGFDYWNILPGQGVYHNPAFIEMGSHKTYSGYVTDIITDLTISTIENMRQNGPFFILCHHKAPHRRWESDQAHANMYANITMPEPPTFNDTYQNRSSAPAHANMRVEDMPDWVNQQPPNLTPEERKKWNYQKFIKEYLRTIASVDDNIGRLLNHIDQSGLRDNTMIIYTTDNGFFLGDHGWFDKRFMYEESLRVPFLIRYPGEIAPGTVNDKMALNIDFAPTFLDYAGVPIPGDMQGTSLRPLFRGQRPGYWRDAMYYHYYEYPRSHSVYPHYGIRTERYKLIHFYSIDEWELFDLQSDPHELVSVYDQPAYADIRRQLKQRLTDMQIRYGDGESSDIYIFQK